MKPELQVGLYAIAIVISFILCGIFSAGEMAITSLTKFKFENYYKKRKHNLTYKIVKKLINEYNMSLSSILIASTLIDITNALVTGMFFDTILIDIAHLPDPVGISMALTTGVMTFLTLVFIEIYPKVFARKYDIRLMQIFGYLYIFCYYLFWPIAWILNKYPKQDNIVSATEQELDSLIDIIKTEGVIESREASLVSNALKLDETIVKSKMTKINNVVWVDYNSDKQKIMNLFLMTDYSRIPIKKNGRFIGFIHLKELIKSKNDWRDKIKPLIFVSQYDNLDKVLIEMQAKQTHIAIVTKNKNEKSVVGIITLEVILENLVGPIYDESDDHNQITNLNNFTWKIELKTPIDKINKALDVDCFNEELIKKIKGKRTHKINSDLVASHKKGDNFFIVEKNQESY